MSTRKCIKNHQHIWDDHEEYPTHLVKQCIQCKVKRWVPRVGQMARPTPPIPTNIKFFD